LTSCRQAAQQIVSKTKRIDILILSAGVFIPDSRETADGLEVHIGVNHYGHFLFGNLLIPLVKRTAKKRGQARVVVVSSDGHRGGRLKLSDLNWQQRSFNSMQAYMDSKLANCLYANELNRRLAGTGVIVNSLHPGVIDSELGRDSKMIRFTLAMMKSMLKTVVQGAATSVYVAISPDLQGSAGGKYYQNSEEADPEDHVNDLNLAQQLWDESVRVTAFDGDL
jgi:NAD(P)-dependent dehydrogenase (short-subunit alcohol dehydrogenase family)